MRHERLSKKKDFYCNYLKKILFSKQHLFCASKQIRQIVVKEADYDVTQVALCVKKKNVCP